jgi:hypothetical protein
MQTVLILLIASVIALTSWLAAWWHTRNPASRNARDELQRLRTHALWLEQRLDTARRERWDRDMIVKLTDQLGIACRQLARAQVRARRRAVARSH